MMKTKRMCPRAAKGGEHELRQDKAGRWYCPIERDAEREREYRAHQKEIDELELMWTDNA